jgi:FixJ family two-component response regulator
MGRGSRLSPEPTVFVIDSDAAFRESARRMLVGVCPQVETYATAADFLDRFDAARTGCLLIEMTPATLAGPELYRRLAEQADGHLLAPVVYVSSKATVPMAVRAMQTGAVSFLEKPVREEELRECVQKAIELDRANRLRFARQADFRRRLAELSDGEREVFDLILAGWYNKEIAARLNLSVRTVEDRRSRLMRKLHVGTLVELIRAAVDAGVSLPGSQQS